MKDDWAVIVGIRVYPGLDTGKNNLYGPENDAIAFAQWICSREGGDVPHGKRISTVLRNGRGSTNHNVRKPFDTGGQAEILLSSDYTPPDFKMVSEGEPCFKRIADTFAYLKTRSDDQMAATGSPRVGRRLYIYCAGHGLEPGLQQLRNKDVAIFTADADREAVNNHFTATKWASWFFDSGVFDEVILLMDCCRESTTSASPMPVTWKTRRIDPHSSEGMFGFSSLPSGRSYEKRMTNNKVHGLFTWALLKGLAGAAAQPGSTNITTRSLADWMSDNLTTYLTAEELADDEIPRECRFEFLGPKSHEIVLCAVSTSPSYPISITIRELNTPETLEIHDGQLKRIADHQASPDANTWMLSLPRGLYLIRGEQCGREVPFVVTGVGGVNVEF